MFVAMNLCFFVMDRDSNLCAEGKHSPATIAFVRRKELCFREIGVNAETR